MVQRNLGIICCCCLWTVPAGAADPEIDYLDPPQGQFFDDWMIVSLSDAKAGYVHTAMSRAGDEISTRTLTYFKIGRAAMPVEIIILQTTRETLDGVPRSFECVAELGAARMAVRGDISNGKVNLTSSQFGVETEQTADLPAHVKMTWGAFRAGIEHGVTPGTTYELEVYDPLTRSDGVLKTKSVVGERVEIKLFEKTCQATKVTTTLELGATSIESISYVDDAGRVLRGEMNFAGFDLALIIADKQSALKDFEPPEFFMDTLIRISRPIDRDTASRIEYELRISGKGRRIGELPTTPMQTPGARTDRTVLVTVSRLDSEALKRIEHIGPTDHLKEYLAASPSLNTRDDAIRKMADEAAGDETRPYALADRLRVYVSKIIKEKNLNIGFATASEVCRNREGDCTEHAVLLAALGRARKLPSRVVIGLAYVPAFVGKKNVFGFHMWTQFHIGGQWVDFDAALQETDCSPARIALKTSSLKDASIGDIAFAIMGIIRGLEIEIKSIEHR